MGFKLKGAPYDKSNMNIAVYKKDLTDGSIGKSNHTGIIVQSGISPEEEQHVIAHEKVHQEQQAKGELDYDKENFYWKGKTYPREKLNEHNEELPWEKEAYKASEKSRNKESKDMGSTKFKLKGHRGNNKPFKHMTERGLIGASMDDTSGYNQPDYGSSMYDDDGASAPGEGDPKKVTKETRTTKKDINPETGMKRFTTTTTSKSSSPGSKGSVSYESAYKKVDKDKYPTLESFEKAAKKSNKKDVKVEEQIPTRKAKITASSEPKLRTIKTEKTPPVKTPPTKKKCPPGFAFSNSRGCVEMSKIKKSKKPKKTKKLKQNLSSTKKSTSCVFGQKC